MVLKNIPAISIAELAGIYQSEWKAEGLFVSGELNLVKGADRPFRTDGFIIGICSRGSARFELDLQTYPVEKHCVLATTPRHLYKLAEISDDFLCRFIVFSRSFLVASNINVQLLESLRFLNSGAAPLSRLKEQEAKALLDFMGLIEQKFRSREQPFRLEIIRNLLLAFLYQIEGAYQQLAFTTGRRLSRKEELNAQFQELVFRHFRKERSVRFYADLLFVTPKYLSETVKEVSGRPAGKWIEEAVILEAKALFKLSSMNVAKVAESLHFPNQSFFGKYFKKHTGKSPSAYLNY